MTLNSQSQNRKRVNAFVLICITVCALTYVIWWQLPSDFFKPEEQDTKPLALTGDPANGKSLFFTTRLACAQCHKYGDEGGESGPDLTLIHKQYPDHSSYEIAILRPGQMVSESFSMCTVAMKDGRVLSGVIESDGDRRLLRLADGKVVELDEGDIDSIQKSAMSPMPNDYPTRLTVQELYDLIAFLSIPEPGNRGP